MKNKKINKITSKNALIVIFALIFFAFSICIAFNQTSKTTYAESDYTSQINTYLTEYYIDIKNDIKHRSAGSVGEKFLANKLAVFMENKGLEKYGELETYLQNFKIKNGTSNNVVGVIDNNAEKYVVIGAHYDAVYKAGKSYGYNDNFSGIVANMIMTEILKNQTEFNVIVGFWGAEEIGMLGSNHFAKNLPNEIRDNILLYINFDSIGAGDYLYYYHNDFETKYGDTLDKFFKGSEVKKYGNQLYSNNANLGVNYTNLGLNSDNISFLKQAINSLNFFAGNLDANNGLGFFETEGHDKIMHNTDSKETIDDVFGDKFVANINSIIQTTESLLMSTDFNATNFANGQIKTFLYSDWVLKGIGVSIVALMFIGYVIYNKTTSRKK